MRSTVNGSARSICTSIVKLATTPVSSSSKFSRGAATARVTVTRVGCSIEVITSSAPTHERFSARLRDLDLRAEHNSRNARRAANFQTERYRSPDDRARILIFFPDFAHGALVAALTAMAGAAEEITE